MKKAYLFIITTVSLAIACKKHPTDLTPEKAVASEVQESNISTPCYGNTWTDVGEFTPGVYVLHLTYNNKLYVFDNPNYIVPDKELHIYDGTSWQTIYSNIPIHTNHPRAFAFVINNKGYMGISGSSAFYEYNFTTNSFTPKTAYPGIGEYGVATFSIGNRGYIMGGTYTQNGNTYNSNDTWEYNPVMNTWTQKADFAWLGMRNATGFTVGSRGYLVNGKIALPGGDIYSNSLFEYNPWTDTWDNKAVFPGDPRIFTNAFVIGNYAYAGGGYSIISGSWTDYPDFYKYNPANDQWTQIADISVQAPSWFNSFSINSKGYVVCHADHEETTLVKYTPRTCPVVGPTP